MASEDRIGGFKIMMLDEEACPPKLGSFIIILDQKHPGLQYLKKERAQTIYAISGKLSKPTGQRVILKFTTEYVPTERGANGPERTWKILFKVPKEFKGHSFFEAEKLNLKEVQGVQFDLAHKYDSMREGLVGYKKGTPAIDNFIP